MQFLQSPIVLFALWAAFYLAVAALVFWFSPKTLAWIQEEFKLGNWVISKSSRAWLAALWIGFLVGAAVVLVVFLIVFGCSSFGGERQDEDEAGTTLEALDEDDGALPRREGAEP